MKPPDVPACGSAPAGIVGVSAFPPVDRLLALLHIFQRAGNEVGAASMSPVTAELPKLAGCPLVAWINSSSSKASNSPAS